MSHVYTPGIKILKSTIIEKERVLPIPGKVLVSVGDCVSPSTIVCQALLQSPVEMVPLAFLMGIEPWQTSKVLLKKTGDPIEEGELIAFQSKLFGLVKKEYRSKISGTLEYVSDVTGTIGIRKPPVAITKTAFISGKVVKVIPDLGAVIRTRAAYIQGVFGISGEKFGELKVVASADEVLTARHVQPEYSGRILVGGSLATLEFLQKALVVGVKGVITGGIHGKDLFAFLGRPVGVGITGEENLPLTLIITEGMGKMPMAARTFNLLDSLEGKMASISGATQIRAGVIRPEIICPEEEIDVSVDRYVAGSEDEALKEARIDIGTVVRIIRAPYFGHIGKVCRLPPELQVIETESKVRVAEIQLEDGRKVLVPRANLEIIQE